MLEGAFRYEAVARRARTGVARPLRSARAVAGRCGARSVRISPDLCRRFQFTERFRRRHELSAQTQRAIAEAAERIPSL